MYMYMYMKNVLAVQRKNCFHITQQCASSPLRKTHGCARAVRAIIILYDKKWGECLSVSLGVEGRAVGLVNLGTFLNLKRAEVVLGVHLEEEVDLAGESLADDTGEVALAETVGDEFRHTSPVEAAATTSVSVALGLPPVELREGQLAVILG